MLKEEMLITTGLHQNLDSVLLYLFTDTTLLLLCTEILFKMLKYAAVDTEWQVLFQHRTVKYFNGLFGM